MAELIAAYSPPMPAPVKNRAAKYNGVERERREDGGDGVDAERDRKSFLRPNRSVSWPKKSAPTQAPAT